MTPNKKYKKKYKKEEKKQQNIGHKQKDSDQASEGETPVIKFRT